MNRSRLRAPSTDGALLAIPPLQDASDALARNREALARWEYDFQGRSAIVLRDKARSDTMDLARSFMERHGLEPARTPDADQAEGSSPPWVVTGHQPELFHPGVWVKNFAASAIARKAGGVSLNLIVDNDLPKASTIAVPVMDGDGVRRVGVGFDVWPDRDIPFEDLPVGDDAVFSSFPDRVRNALGGIVEDPLIDEFWPRALARREDVPNLGLRFAVARHRIERRWDAANLEVPLSLVCGTDAFLWFLAHILAQLPRFQEIHNAALREYRLTYGIRSRNHPVAALETRDDWREAPFWVWRANRPHRQPLLARQVGRHLQLRIAGEDEPLVELPLGPDREACCAVESLRELAERSVRIRTRALTTTLFSRILIGDLFLHGIGGAKYDELGDSIARRFFGIEPPTFLTLSQTIWLGLPVDPSYPERLETVRRQLRDAEFNPDRLLAEPFSPEIRRIVEAKRSAISGPQGTRRERKARRKEIRRRNEQLQPHVEGIRERLESRLHLIQKGLISNRIAASREYSLVLHSQRKLQATMYGLSRSI